MSSVTTSIGITSGIDYGKLTDALINAQKAPVDRLSSRLKNLQASETALNSLQVNLLGVSTSVQRLSDPTTYRTFAVQNSDTSQLTIATRSNTVAGNYQLQALRRATTEQSISRGFVNVDQQTLGTAGTLTISQGGRLATSTRLDVLNGGGGVQRGTIRITNRAGVATDIDLRTAVSVDDVVSAINSQTSAGVQARADGTRLVLTDTTGSTSSNLLVSDLNGGQAAQDLGIRQSIATSTLNGSNIYQATSDFAIGLLNDGNGLRHKTGQNDLQFTLSDGTQLVTNLDGTATVGDVVTKINSATGNSGKLTASVANGRLTLVDSTSGAGTLTVTNLSGSNAKDVFGLNSAAVGNTLTGQPLVGGINSVLLRNLRGGAGITQPGQLTLTDRTGATATVDLTNATSLSDVLNAINTATTTGGTKLQLSAQLDSNKTGITVTDTSGSTSSNLVIADVGGGTVAQNLGIAVNAGQTSIVSGDLGLRRVNQATKLSNYAPSGGAVATGSFKVTNSNGTSALINVSTATQTLGDVIDQINGAALNVSAALNATGDGITVTDAAGGTGALKIEEVGGTTAADLRLAGTGTPNSGGQSQITGRQVVEVSLAGTDTLSGIVAKVNAAGGAVRASIVNTGSAINPFRLALTSTTSGQAGQFNIDSGTTNLGFTKQVQGQDAVLRVGDNPATAFVLTSGSNTFSDVNGIDVTVQTVGTSAANVTTSVDGTKLTSAIQSLVTSYNTYVDAAAKASQFDPTTNARGVLQGEGVLLRIQSRFSAIFNKFTAGDNSPIRSLADLGLAVGTNNKLTFDQNKLTSALQSNPELVRKTFIGVGSGVAPQLNSAITEFTDSTSGSLTLLAKSYDTTATTLTDRIAALNDSLNKKRTQLTQKFASLESVLTSLNKQSTALTSFAASLTNSSK